VSLSYLKIIGSDCAHQNVPAPEELFESEEDEDDAVRFRFRVLTRLITES
jgi:hypothetical protein